MERKDDITYTSIDIYSIFRATKKRDPKIASLEALQEKYKTESDTGLPSKEIALRRAAHQGNLGDIEVLIDEYEADIKSKSSNGFSALDWAYFNGHMHAVNALCWLKADQSLLKPLLWKYVSETEKEWPIKNIALCRAAEKGNLKDTEVLVNRYKADLNFKNDEGYTALALAEKGKHTQAIQWIKNMMQPRLDEQETGPSMTLK